MNTSNHFRRSASWFVSLAFALGATHEARASIVFVDASSACSEACGGTWEAAYSSISSALDSIPGESETTLWVAKGVYGPIQLRSNVKILGGFSVGASTAEERLLDSNATVIDARGGGRAVVAEGVTNVVVDGLAIRGGVARGMLEGGGGVLLRNSVVTFDRCIFMRNVADLAGGAVAVYGGDVTLMRCLFRHNGTDQGERPRPMAGGAIFNHSGELTLYDCVLHRNIAHEGGAIASHGRPILVLQSTIANNVATGGRGGAISDLRNRVVLRSSILWKNRRGTDGPAEWFVNPAIPAPIVSASSVPQFGTGVEAGGQVFVSDTDADYRLAAGSPLRDLGDPDLRSKVPEHVRARIEDRLGTPMANTDPGAVSR